MKKRIFDIRVFCENFRQLSWLALSIGGVIILVSVLSLMAAPLSSNIPLQLHLLSPDVMQPLLFLSFCLAAPFLTLKVFRYTTERRGSDFYHALPQSRSCLFLSLMAAVFCWLILIMIASGLVSGFTAGLFPKYYQFSWNDLLLYNLSMLLISLYVAAVTACAVHISGTVFSNVLVSLLLLFGPRLIIYVLVQSVVDLSPVLMRGFLPFPYGINLFSALLYGILDGLRSVQNSALYDGWHMLYTCLAIAVWILLGVFLAKKRASERAETPIGNRYVRAGIRVGMAFLFCLEPIHSILSGSFATFDVFVFYLLALLFFFGFELFATKSFKALTKLLPSLMILLALNIGVFVLCRASIRAVNTYQPEAEDIQYIRIISNPYQSSHLDQAVQECRIENKAVHQLLSEALKENLKLNEREDYYSLYEIKTNSQLVAIKSGPLERYRRLQLDSKELEALGLALAQDQAFSKAYMEIPDEKILSGQIFYSSLFAFTIQDEELASRIYQSLRAEVKEIGFAAWYRHQNTPPEGSFRVLRFRSNYHGVERESTYFINNDLPKTFSLFLKEEATYNQKEKDKALALLKSWAEQAERGTFFLNLETDSAHSVSWDREWVVLPADASQEEIRRIKERQAGIITPEQLNRLIDMLSQMNDPEYESAPCRLTLDAGGKHYGSVTALFAAKEIPPFLEELMKENP